LPFNKKKKKKKTKTLTKQKSKGGKKKKNDAAIEGKSRPQFRWNPRRGNGGKSGPIPTKKWGEKNDGTGQNPRKLYGNKTYRRKMGSQPAP